MAATYDGVVIGAGVMGASSALQLACGGMKRVLTGGYIIGSLPP